MKKHFLSPYSMLICTSETWGSTVYARIAAKHARLYTTHGCNTVPASPSARVRRPNARSDGVLIKAARKGISYHHAPPHTRPGKLPASARSSRSRNPLRRIPVATPMLRESTPGSMWMRSRWSQATRTCIMVGVKTLVGNQGSGGGG